MSSLVLGSSRWKSINYLWAGAQPRWKPPLRGASSSARPAANSTAISVGLSSSAGSLRELSPAGTLDVELVDITKPVAKRLGKRRRLLPGDHVPRVRNDFQP